MLKTFFKNTEVTEVIWKVNNFLSKSMLLKYVTERLIKY